MRPKTFFTARFFVLLSLLFCAASLTQAYTLVLKNGRHMQVGDNIVVSGRTVICEMGNDITMSFQLASIDIPATERANRELPGSFLKRTSQAAPTMAPSESQPTTKPMSSVTNRDLEKYRRRRLESEKAYEARRKQLGLPSREALRSTVAEDTERSREAPVDRLSRVQAQEQYWRGRASDLRSDINATDAQINYLQARLGEMPTNASSFSTLSTYPFGGTYPYGVRSRVSPNLGPVFLPGPHITPQIGPVISQRRYPNNRSRFPIGGYGRRSRYETWPIYETWPVFGVPSSQNTDDVQYQTMVEQLEQLRLQRVRLQSMWRDLEDEARRAGAYPGWLRP